jgi:GT2 family glycosyltransferase
MTIRFPAVDRPRVSVVIVSYGGWDLLSTCLSTLRVNTDLVYEVVILDSASPDKTAECLRREVVGARMLFEDKNVGFAVGSNKAAAAARAPLLCFLNPDAFVQPGWLPPLIEVLERHVDVGAVVPLLLNEDGTIQEAGSVVDSEAWAIALGADAPASSLEYQFGRDVAFGSAACLLTRKSHFDRVGGFDPAYRVGYYEDVDLCFKLAELGLRTRFEPRSTVVHVRFGSSTSASARRQVQENRLVFVDRWSDRLKAQPRLTEVPRHAHRLVAARDLHAYERILIFDDRVPHVDRGSGDPRMAKLLLQAASLWPKGRITLVAASADGAVEYARPLLEAGIEVVAPPVDWDDWFTSRAFHYSVVVVSRSSNAERFREHLRSTQPQAMRIFDAEALTFRRLDRQALLTDEPEQQGALRVLALAAAESEIRAVEEADLVFTVSEEERAFVQAVAPEKPVILLPSYVEPQDDPPGFDARHDVIFFGGFLGGSGSPNEDALLHLVREVMPLVWEAEPELKLRVIGADPTEAVIELQNEHVDVIGYVADPIEWLGEARVHVHPMRFGAGIKLKLLETMAAGLPFVTTRVGAEGLGLGDLGALLVNDEPVEIARRTLLLYRDRDLWENTQLELLDLVKSRFSRESFRRTLAEAMVVAGLDATRTRLSIAADG